MRWDLGIDLGTRCVRLTELGESGLFSAPAAIALREDKQSLLCAGDLAFRLTGRTREGVGVHYPLKDGVLENNLYADRLFAWLYRNTDSGSRKRRFNVLVTCAPFARPVQKEALVGAALSAGASEAALIRSDVAAAVGADLDLFAPEAKLVIDLGAGKITCTLFTLGRVAAFGSLPYGMNRINDRVIRQLRTESGYRVGDAAAEEIKRTLGSALPDAAPKEVIMHSVGIGLSSRLPKSFDIETSLVLNACEDVVSEVARMCAAVVEAAPEGLCADLVDTGAVLVGGGAQLTDIDRRLTSALGIPCRVADNPEECATLGLDAILRDPKKYEQHIENRRVRTEWNA